MKRIISIVLSCMFLIFCGTKGVIRNPLEWRFGLSQKEFNKYVSPEEDLYLTAKNVDPQVVAIQRKKLLQAVEDQNNGTRPVPTYLRPFFDRFVLIKIRDKDEQGFNCSGTVIVEDQELKVLTAYHCFRDYSEEDMRNLDFSITDQNGVARSFKYIKFQVFKSTLEDDMPAILTLQGGNEIVQSIEGLISTSMPQVGETLSYCSYPGYLQQTESAPTMFCDSGIYTRIENNVMWFGANGGEGSSGASVFDSSGRIVCVISRNHAQVFFEQEVPEEMGCLPFSP